MTAKPPKSKNSRAVADTLGAAKHDPFPLEVWQHRGLRCPTCLSNGLTLASHGRSQFIVCEACDGVFSIVHGTPQMLDVRTLLALSEDDFHAHELGQRNATPEYRTLSPDSVALSTRDDVRQVMSHLKIEDLSVLDIGSGVFLPPEYLQGKGAREIIGLDPMLPEAQPQFDLVGGFAEFLPFAEARFDAVTAITSTDHFIDLDNALREVRRVLKPGGTFYVWHEFTSDTAMIRPFAPVQKLPRLPVAPSTGSTAKALAAYAKNQSKLAARRKAVPADWKETTLVDPFHAQHLERGDFERRLSYAGLALVEEVPIQYPNGGTNSFMVIRHQTHVLAALPISQTQAADESIARIAGLLDSGFRANAVGLVNEVRALLDLQSNAQSVAMGEIKTAVEMAEEAQKKYLKLDETVARIGGMLDAGFRANATGLVSEFRALLDLQGNSLNTAINEIASANKATQEAQRKYIRTELQKQPGAVLEMMRAMRSSLADKNDIEAIRVAQEKQRIFGIDQGIYLSQVIGDVNATMQQQILGLHQRLEQMQAVQEQIRLEANTLGRLKNIIKRIGRFVLMPLLPFVLLAKFISRPFLRIAQGAKRVSGLAFGQEHQLLRSSLLRSLFWPAKRTKSERRRILMLTISMIEIDPRINKIAKSLVEQGWEVDILCQQPTVVEEFLTFEQVAPGIRYIRVKWAPEYMRHWLYYQHIFLRAARELDFDYVHVNDMTTLLVGWLISRTRGKPLVYDAHEMWSENVEWDGKAYVGMPKRTRTIARLFEGFMLRYVDSFYSVSPSILVEYKRRHGRAPLMLANFPDIPTLDKDVTNVPSIRTLAGIPDDKFVTIYLGGLGPARNIEAVIEAHKHLDDRFVFVIRGPDAHIWGEKNLEYARTLGVEDHIRVLPGVGRDDILAGMKGADCGIVMLRNLCNNFYWFYPNKFFEYAMGGIPVVVSNFPDVSAHIEREKNGITVDPHDPEDIARGLRWLADHPEEKREMGRRGRESILREYNWHTAVKVMQDDYEAMWKKARGKA